MYVKKIDNVLGFERLADKWQSLQSHSDQRNVFLTYEWLRGWWEFAGDGKQLYLLTVEDDDGEMVGLAPFMITQKRLFGVTSIRQVTFLGTGAASSDHLDILSRSGQEGKVAKAICAYLRQHHAEWDGLHLTDLPQESITLDILRREFANDYMWIEEEGATCPYLPIIIDSWESYLENKSKRARRSIRYNLRRFENKLNGRFVLCETEPQVKRSLQRLFELNTARWNEKGKHSAFAEEAFQSFHQKIGQLFLSKGWLDLAYLEIENQIAAVMYSYKYGNKIFFYNTAFDAKWSKYSLGSVLMVYCLQRAFAEGIEEYDFLRGTHSYKYEWTSLAKENRNVTILQQNRKMRMWHEMQQSTRKARRQVKQHLPSNIKQILKRKNL